MSWPQYLTIAGVATGSLFAVISNLITAILIVKIFNKNSPSGFNSLCINHLVIQFWSILLVSPWYMLDDLVFQGSWVYSDGFCYLSVFCLSCLPFMCSWNMTLMALHQLGRFVFLDHSWNGRWTLSSTRWVKRIKSIILPILIWIIGAGIYGPVNYSRIISSSSNSSNLCGTAHTVLFMHQGLSTFFIPSITALIFLIAIFIFKLYSHRMFPAIESAFTETGNLTIATFRATDSSSELPAETSGRPRYTSYRHFSFNDVDYHKDNLLTSDNPYNDEPSTPLVDIIAEGHVTTNRDISMETVTMTCLLFITTVVFHGPYYFVSLFIEDPAVPEDGINSIWILTTMALPWMLLQAFFEPIIMLIVIIWFRRSDLQTIWSAKFSNSVAQEAVINN